MALERGMGPEHRAVPAHPLALGLGLADPGRLIRIFFGSPAA
jgi:hypothetical protein